jgi:hypothetical protein
MKNNSSNGQLTASRPADSPVLTETIKRLRNQTPAESLGLPAGSGLMKPFLQATVACLILLALLTVVPYFVDPKVEAKGPPPIPERQESTETPKDQPSPKPGSDANAKAPTAPGPKGNNKADDLLNKLGETGTKTAPLKVNPLDKKDDDLLKDIK